MLVAFGLLVLSGCGSSQQDPAIDAYNRGVTDGKERTQADDAADDATSGQSPVGDTGGRPWTHTKCGGPGDRE